jgi:hypothetical protein
MNVNELAKALENLSREDALALIDSIARVQERAAKHREEQAVAERERDERYPACSCGKPAATAGFFMWYSIACKPGVERKNGALRGGVVFVGDSDYNDAPSQPDVEGIDRKMWFSCGECASEWKGIENGFGLKVGEVW